MTPRRAVRLALAALAVLAACCGLLVIGLSGGLFQEQLRARAERALQQAVGRPVRIERLALQLHRGSVELAGLRIGDRPELPLFTAEVVRIGWRWPHLLSRRIVLDDIRVTAPRLTLSFASRDAPPPSAPDLSGILFLPRASLASGWSLSLSGLRLERGAIAWTQSDGRTGRLDRLEGEIVWLPGGKAVRASLEGSRLAVPLGADIHRMERPRLRVEATSQALSIEELSGVLLGFPVKLTGRLSDLGAAARLDLQAAGEMTLTEIARLAGSSRTPEGRLSLRARIQGDWANPIATGTGVLRFGPTGSGTPLDFRFRWADGRLRAETTGVGPSSADAGSLLVDFTPSTRAFQTRLRVRGLELTAVRGLPAALLTLAGIAVPPELRGRLTATAELSGRGPDPGAWRGQGTFALEGFAWGDLVAGRLAGRMRVSADRLALEEVVLSLPQGRIRGGGSLEPSTQGYRVALTVRDLDLAANRRLSADLASRVGLALPGELRGRLTARMEASGRRGDPGTFEGAGSLRIDGLTLGADRPPGRLAARLRVVPEKVTIDDLALAWPGGTLRGRGAVDPRTGAFELPVALEVQDAGSVGRALGAEGFGGSGRLAGTLAGTREAPRFHGRIRWNQPRVLDLTLDRIEGGVSLDGRQLATSDLTVRLGRTSATLRGTLTAAGSTPLQALEPKRDLAVDLAVDLTGRTADLARFLPAGLDLSGTGRASGRLGGTPATLTGEASLDLADLRTWGERWERGAALLRFAPGSLQLSEIVLQRGAERVTGRLSVSPDSRLEGRLDSTPMELAGISWLRPLDLAGLAAFHLELRSAGGTLGIQGKARADSLGFRGLDLGPSTASFALERGSSDVRLEFRRATHRLHLRTTPEPAAALQAELSLEGADLDLLLGAAKAPVPAGTTAQGDGVVRFRAPLAALSSGAAEAEFSRLRILRGGESFENIGPLRLAWRDSALTISPMTFRARGGELRLQGFVSGDGRGDLAVAGTLPLTALASGFPAVQVTRGTATLGLRLTGRLDSPGAEGDVTVTGGALAMPPLAAPLTDLAATLRLSRDTIRVVRLAGALAGGTVTASGEIRRRADAWQLAGEYAVRDVRVDGAISGSLLTGRLSASGALASHGRHPAEFRRSLQGSLRLECRDGRFGASSLLAKLLSLASIQALFQPGSLELRGRGTPYRTLLGDFRIREGVARTDNLVADSPAFLASGVGHVDLADETLEATVAIRPFKTLDAAIASVPVAGWLLGGKDGGLVVAYVRASGSIRDPKIESLPLQSVGDSLFGTFRGLLKLPAALPGEGASSAPPDSPKASGKRGADERDTQ